MRPDLTLQRDTQSKDLRRRPPVLGKNHGSHRPLHAPPKNKTLCRRLCRRRNFFRDRVQSALRALVAPRPSEEIANRSDWVCPKSQRPEIWRWQQECCGKMVVELTPRSWRKLFGRCQQRAPQSNGGRAQFCNKVAKVGPTVPAKSPHRLAAVTAAGFAPPSPSRSSSNARARLERRLRALGGAAQATWSQSAADGAPNKQQPWQM